MKYRATNIVGVLLQVRTNPSYRRNVHKQHIMALSDLLEYIIQFSVVRKSKCETLWWVKVVRSSALKVHFCSKSQCSC